MKPQHHKQAKPRNDSKTNVHFSKGGAYKYVSGVREPISIRIDSGLYCRFKQLSKLVYGSVCKAVEVDMISFINAVETGVHFCNTGKPLNIEQNIVVTRDVKTRRKLVVEETVTETRTVADVKKDERAEWWNRGLGNAADQWLVHPDREWREKWKDTAREHSELPNSALVLSLSATAGWPS